MAGKQPPPRGPQLEIAGDLAVAFVNTAAARDKNRQQGVSSYDELLTWAQQVGVLQAHDAESLAARAAEDPAAARTVWQQAARGRLALARLFVAVQLDEDLPADELAIFNQALARAAPAARLVPAEQGFAWGWSGDAKALDRMLWPIWVAAGELLISTGGLPHVRQCALKACRLFFVDRSPSKQRRWCEMKSCGNRAKSLRHYYRRGRAQRDKEFRDLGIWRTRRPRKRESASQGS